MRKNIISLLFSVVFLLLAGISYSAGPPPMAFPQKPAVNKDTNCNQAKYYANGVLCQDTDDAKVYIGTGAAVTELTTSLSTGDMTKAVYDTDADNHVDDAELLKVKSVAGYVQAVGVSAGATREKTVRDANDTLLELGGNYTPTGTWNWASATLTLPASITTNASTATALAANGANCSAGQLPLGVDASGAAEGCTATPSLQALTLTGANTISLGTSSTNTGSAIFKNSTNANAFTITSGVSGAAIGWTLPTAAPGGNNYLLNVDADGTMGYTDPSTLGGGTAGKVCKTITNPSDADNILFDIASARTITKISGICVGGTSVVITLQDAGADGSGSTSIDDAITIDTDGANGGAITYAIHDGDIVKLDIGTVTGVVTQVMVCYE